MAFAFIVFLCVVESKNPFTLQSADAFLFHTPYCKLVQKSLARLMLNDYLSDASPDFDGMYAGLEKFRCDFVIFSCNFFLTYDMLWTRTWLVNRSFALLASLWAWNALPIFSPLVDKFECLLRLLFLCFIYKFSYFLIYFLEHYR